MTIIPKKILTGLSVMAVISAFAATPELKLYDVDITLNEKTQMLDIVLDIHLKDYNLNRNSEIEYTPLIISANGTDSLSLDPFTVCGRNSYYWHLREGDLTDGSAAVYRSGSNEQARILRRVPIEEWMLENSTIEMRATETSCCSEPRQLPGNTQWGNTALACLHSKVPVLNDIDFIFAPPMTEEPVKKSIEGKAFVTFVVNRTELNPRYMDNPVELKKITNSIDAVKADPDAIITEVHIRGYASPEGSYENNVRLAQGRTETLAAYVNGLYKFERGIMTTSYEPEDWSGLRSYVADSMSFNLSDREGLLKVIDGTLDPDAKDKALKTGFPKDYQVILKEIYPWLRHSDYTVKYNIKVYSDLADLMRLYNSEPSKLRGVDFYTIAQQYPTGSPEYISVMRKAVEIYPDDPMLNLNMANIYMIEGNYDAAQSCLLKAGRSPQADYARGVLAAKRGDFEEAAKWFGIAKEGGIKPAGTYEARIDECLNADPVEILIQTTKQ